jgi:diguanylate cyclase (GGDEF)-like protein/PAS domain S-box-containing protein
MSIASRAPQNHAPQLRGVLAADGSRLLLVAANAVGALCIVTSIFGWVGLGNRLLLDSLAFEGLIVLSTALFARSALAQPGRWRRPWLVIASGLIAVLLGSLTAALYQVILGSVPSPSLADVFFLAFYPLVLAGLLQFPRAVTTRSEAVGFALDAVAVLFGTGMVIAYVLIIPHLRSAGGDLGSVFVSSALPLGDVLLAFGLGSLVIRRRSLPRDGSMAFLAGALLLLLASDFIYSYLSISGEANGTLQTSMGALSWILVAWAGYERLRNKDDEGGESELTLPHVAAYLVAYLAAIAGFVVLLLAASDILDTPLGIMIVAAVAVTPLLLARQVVALRESGTLHELKGTQETEERFRSLVTNSSDTIFVTDEHTAIQYATPSAASILGYEAADLHQRRLTDLVHPDDVDTMLSQVRRCSDRPAHSLRGEWRLSDHAGRWHFMETVVANMLEDPHVSGLVFTSRDIGERIRFQDELQHQAFHDALTGLANRVLFKERVEHSLAAQRDSKVAVLFMDVDDFKLVNDSYGHVLGDTLLVQVGDRLGGILRAGDTAARLGGDEFAILLEGVNDPAVAADVAQRVLCLFDEDFWLDETHLPVSVSIGVAVSDGSHTSAEELLRDADVAMYSAKAHGKDRVEVFEPAMQTAVLERLELANELRRAVDRHEFVVFYQPIVEISTQRIIGTEALVRWQHPTEGLKQPGWFIHVAEETGLITPIGDFVLEQACRQARRWQEDLGLIGLRMAVNLSPWQLKDPELVAKVRGVLASTKVEPRLLTLEITETALVEESQAMLARLRELKALGVRLSIDDFGTGYSSLSYLRQFPMDGVKIAKPFVDHIAQGTDDSALARAIITLGETLELEVIAEGIEYEPQMRELRRLGCKLGQGFYTSRPLPADQLGTLLAGTLPGN